MAEAVLTLSEAVDRANAREPIIQWMDAQAPRRSEAAYALARMQPLTPTTGQMGARPMTEATNSVHLAKLRARLHFATRPQGNEGQSPRPRPEVHSLLTARHRCPSRRLSR